MSTFNKKFQRPSDQFTKFQRNIQPVPQQANRMAGGGGVKGGMKAPKVKAPKVKSPKLNFNNNLPSNNFNSGYNAGFGSTGMGSGSYNNPIELEEVVVYGTPSSPSHMSSGYGMNYGVGYSEPMSIPGGDDPGWQIPGIANMYAANTTLANQPLYPSATSPVGSMQQQPTGLGEMPKVGPGELAAKGVAQVPTTTGMTNPNTQGINFSKTPSAYLTNQDATSYGLNTSPAQIAALKNAGTTSLVTPGGNNQLTVDHEANHNLITDELQNRAQVGINMRNAGSPYAKAAYGDAILARDAANKNIGYTVLENALYPKYGSVNVGAVNRAVDDYGVSKPIYIRGSRVVPHAKGGKIEAKKWEGSKKDEAQDKKLAKKHGMSMKKWEKSKMDKKHDEQKSMKGLEGKTKGKTIKMCGGGMKGYAGGGVISSKKADGIASKGRTKCKIR